jgi:4-amino-4-deoxy-L-arabinose transferase-like glycosyltransferase
MKSKPRHSRKTLLLLLIFGIGIFFRIWKLDSVPPSPSLDEVTIGWNAYSISKTGADEYGTIFPILLRAYDDWRPALYVYAVVPFVKFIGLNVVAVRLPSVIASIVILFLTYKIAEMLFDGKDKPDSVAAYAPLTATLLVALSPWHIYISRLGHEANFGLLFTVLGVYFFIKSIKENSVRTLTYSVISFILTMYSYQSEKIVTPALIFCLVLIFGRQIAGFGKKLIIPVAVGLIVFIPVAVVSLSPEGLSRFSGTNAISGSQLIETGKVKSVAARAKGDLIGRIINSPKFIGFSIISGNYISHLNPKWLFSGGTAESFKIPNMGLINLIEIPFILAGFIFLIYSTLDRRYKFMLIAWFLTAPLPASLTTGAPHAMRSYTFIPVWQLIGAYGFLELFRRIKIKNAGILFLVMMDLGALLTMNSIWRNYFTEFPRLQSNSFQYALNKTLPDVISNEGKYNRILVSNQGDTYQSYMFYLYHAKYDPVIYQKSGGTVSGGYAETHTIGKYIFRPIDWEKDRLLPNTLFIAARNDVAGSAPVFKTYTYLDGEAGVKLMETGAK